MITAMDAERIKLTSTRSPYWCVAIVAVLTVGLALVTGATISGPLASTPGEAAWTALIGLNSFGLLVLMIMAVLAVTSEYRFGTIRTTFQAVPRRSTVLIAKAAVFGLLALLVSLVLAVVGVAVAKAAGGSTVGIDIGDSIVIRQLWGTAVLAALYVLIGLGVGAIVRHTAGAIVILLIWNLALESILTILPRVGDDIAPFLPFANGSRFLNGDLSATDYHWNVYGSLIYFAMFAVVIFVLGIVATERRDA
ncbi:ABC transporter permease [Gordonia sp. HNM0687]|uniref:ABC transporter permease n=1 Tax=Gordonia mangrovi TaxID=2665643 RepID=A0A6L7GVS2_9ACTN|nr:ABC transporter permease [Gordonia mangrovi]MDY6808486.1 ABC transporter permease [Actinomycetota bacterium]MXP23663.1 ABC transporter permease [Gordonia mangrovi]UVF79726.1 ABC transporter permease [Gordonia mangrovi]